MPDRTRARQLAAEYVAKGDPTGWFEQLYQEAEAGGSPIPRICCSPWVIVATVDSAASKAESVMTVPSMYFWI